MKSILTATVIALLAGTTLAAAQQPTNPPFGDASQPRNDPQLQQQNRNVGTPSTSQQGRTTRQPIDDTSTRNADPHLRSTRPKN
ncbi:MAG: hypothetical protein AB7S93_02935 [Xanthobacteraceae bacterium]